MASYVTEHLTAHGILRHRASYGTRHLASQSTLRHTAYCVTGHLTSQSILRHTASCVTGHLITQAAASRRHIQTPGTFQRRGYFQTPRPLVMNTHPQLAADGRQRQVTLLHLVVIQTCNEKGGGKKGSRKVWRFGTPYLPSPIYAARTQMSTLGAHHLVSTSCAHALRHRLNATPAPGVHALGPDPDTHLDCFNVCEASRGQRLGRLLNLHGESAHTKMSGERWIAKGTCKGKSQREAGKAE
eukprot:366230-Chlamydomonas_euryale.AAC.12